jgi:hypothetical protein
MKLSFLLAHRQTLLRQARLAHLAHAYDRLDDFARRVARARLRGEVRLEAAAPEAGNYSATLTALTGSQSVLEEHFTDGDILRLADAVADVSGRPEFDLAFPIEELAARFLGPLRLQLLQAGIDLDTTASPAPQEGQVDHSRPEPRG